MTFIEIFYSIFALIKKGWCFFQKIEWIENIKTIGSFFKEIPKVVTGISVVVVLVKIAINKYKEHQNNKLTNELLSTIIYIHDNFDTLYECNKSSIPHNYSSDDDIKEIQKNFQKIHIEKILEVKKYFNLMQTFSDEIKEFKINHYSLEIKRIDNHFIQNKTNPNFETQYQQDGKFFSVEIACKNSESSIETTIQIDFEKQMKKNKPTSVFNSFCCSIEYLNYSISPDEFEIKRKNSQFNHFVTEYCNDSDSPINRIYGVENIAGSPRYYLITKPFSSLKSNFYLELYENLENIKNDGKIYFIDKSMYSL